MIQKKPVTLAIGACLALALNGSLWGQGSEMPSKPTDGLTRVYFFTGYHVGVGWRPNLSAVDIIVNDNKIASLKENQYVVADIKAGDYVIGCIPTEPTKNFPVGKSVKFKSGSFKYYACDMDSFAEDTRAKDGAITAAMALPFGFLGGAVGGALGGAIAGATDASLSDFKTKTYLDERPIPSGYQLTEYKRLSEVTPIKSGQSTSATEIQNNSSDTATNKLKELKQMKDQGLISDSEYRSKKKSIIDQM